MTRIREEEEAGCGPAQSPGDQNKTDFICQINNTVTKQYRWQAVSLGQLPIEAGRPRRYL